MNYLDIIIAIPLAWAAFKGFKKGLVIEVSSLVALGLGIYGSIHFSDLTTNWLNHSLDFESKYMPVISFILTFLIIALLVNTLGKIIEKIIDIAALSFINKLLGAAFGLLKILLIISIIGVVIKSIDKKSGFIGQELKDKSLLYEPVTNFSMVVIPKLKDNTLFKGVTESEPEEAPKSIEV